MSHTRSNGQGFAGGKSRQFNKLDTRIITREFTVSASANASQIDTGITLPATTQAISAFIKTTTAEATGTTKTIDVGVFGGTGNEFITGASVASVGVSGLPVTTVQDTSTNDTIGYTFGSGDFAELECVVSLTLVVGE